MTKAQAAALLLAGALAGVGGTKLVGGGAEAAVAVPIIFVHAVDYRADHISRDGGFTVHRSAFGTELRPDGGTRDVGQAKKCNESAQAALRAEMQAAAKDCTWDLQ